MFTEIVAVWRVISENCMAVFLNVLKVAYPDKNGQLIKNDINKFWNTVKDKRSQMLKNW